MKTRAFGVALVALSMSLSSLAMAQERGHDRGRGNGHADQRFEQRNDRHGDRRADHRDQRRDFGRHESRGAGPDHRFYRGQRLPAPYRSRQYVVDDWRGHRLSAPPRGYHWVQTGSDYVLAAIATGVILQVILNN